MGRTWIAGEGSGGSCKRLGGTGIAESCLDTGFTLPDFRVGWEVDIVDGSWSGDSRSCRNGMWTRASCANPEGTSCFINLDEVAPLVDVIEMISGGRFGKSLG